MTSVETMQNSTHFCLCGGRQSPLWPWHCSLAAVGTKITTPLWITGIRFISANFDKVQKFLLLRPDRSACAVCRLPFFMSEKSRLGYQSLRQLTQVWCIWWIYKHWSTFADSDISMLSPCIIVDNFHLVSMSVIVRILSDEIYYKHDYSLSQD
jgi:hypothetical protein